MSKEMAVIALGVWTIIIPYLGVPGGVRTVLLILTGVALIFLGFIMRGEAINRGSHGKHSRGSAFVENDTASVAHDYSEHPSHPSDGISSRN